MKEEKQGNPKIQVLASYFRMSSVAITVLFYCRRRKVNPSWKDFSWNIAETSWTYGHLPTFPGQQPSSL